MVLVTPKRICSVYHMLLHFPPFVRWSLPHPDKVKFLTTDDMAVQGAYNISPSGGHSILINPHIVTTMLHLVETVAHEMVHMRQEMTGKRPALVKDEQHNKEFYRLQRIVCRDMGFDPTRF